MLKMILLPRQARDKHSESTQKEVRFFLQVNFSLVAEHCNTWRIFWDVQAGAGKHRRFSFCDAILYHSNQT